jgi:4-coumarate--CoA ligase
MTFVSQFHAAAAPVAHTTPLRSGEKCYVMPRFDLEKWFWAHEKYGVTDVAMVPPVSSSPEFRVCRQVLDRPAWIRVYLLTTPCQITIMAINSPLKDKYNLTASKLGSVGAAPLDKHPQARMQELLGGKPLTQVWGMTETSCIATRLRYPSYDTTGSVGVPVPNLDVKLVDDSGKDITGFDVRGEICVRGPTVIRGYFENPEANKRDFDEDGYFHTGDIAYVARTSGLYYIVDRKKVSACLLLTCGTAVAVDNPLT